MAASAAIILGLGLLHLLFTFRGPNLTPRDPALQQRMTEVSLVLTSRTTMWKAWVGFNASHSLGAILFGLIYGWLALVNSDLLFGSPFLIAVGLAMLAGLAVLGKLYWFRDPYRCICVALACYVAAIVMSRG